MENKVWMLGVLCLLIAVAIVIWNHRRTKKTMDVIEQMLSAAMGGEYSEQIFDESRLSALETKFAHYFSASAVSMRNVANEKDKIKKLIADISHQTKTPIANLLLYSELLKEEDLTEAARSNADAMYAQTKKLQFLIDSLVKLSRLETGIIALAPRQEEIWPMIESVGEQYGSKAESKGLYLQLKGATVMAKFDPKWTAEALGNIVDNAIKYTSKGGITITAVPYEMFVRIDIADTGIGISEDEQAKIFSRFYRAEDTKEQEGIGIGLYLAREIVSGEGGYIKVTSNRGKGSVFSVFLPR